MERKEGRGKKDYLVRMFGVAGDAEMDAGSPWLSLFLHDRLLAVINGYLGVFSKLNAIDVWNTVPVEHDGAYQGSQRWHRDPEDSRLVKVFLYLNDVGAGAGAMQYVAQSRRGDRYGRLWPQKFPAGNYPPAGALERIVDPRDRIDCSGLRAPCCSSTPAGSTAADAPRARGACWRHPSTRRRPRYRPSSLRPIARRPSTTRARQSGRELPTLSMGTAMELRSRAERKADE